MSQLLPTELPPIVWQWLMHAKDEKGIAAFFEQQLVFWLKTHGRILPERFLPLVEHYAESATRYLMAENDLGEAISLGLSVFHDTPYDVWFEDEEVLSTFMCDALITWHSNKND